MISVWKDKSLSVRAKVGVFDDRVFLMVLYGWEAWALDDKLWKSVNVLEMKNSRPPCGVMKVDHIRNYGVRKRSGSKKSVYDRAEEGVQKWPGHLERMNERGWLRYNCKKWREEYGLIWGRAGRMEWKMFIQSLNMEEGEASQGKSEMKRCGIQGTSCWTRMYEFVKGNNR